MYRLTCKLLALYSLVLPTLAAVVVSEQKRELDKRDTYNGKGTWYNPGLGSCGGTNNDDQLVVALSQDIMNNEGDCWKMVQITSNGKESNAQVVDTCTGCGQGDLYMSPALFERFGPLEEGTVSIAWSFLN